MISADVRCINVEAIPGDSNVHPLSGKRRPKTKKNSNSNRKYEEERRNTLLEIIKISLCRRQERAMDWVCVDASSLMVDDEKKRTTKYYKSEQIEEKRYSKAASNTH